MKKFTPGSSTNRGNTYSSMLMAEMLKADDISTGAIISVTDYGNAPFLISDSSTVVKVGDQTLDSGQVAVLQSDAIGQFSVEWFGASGLDSAVDQLAYFNLAAARSNEEENGDTKVSPIFIPKGDWRVSAPVSESSTWVLAPNAIMYGLAAISPTGERDTSYLTGTVIMYNGVDQQRTLLVGDPSYAVQKYTGKGYTAEMSANGKISGGVSGTAHTSSRTTSSEGCIGGTFVGVADNPTVAMGAWSAYFEAYKTATADDDSNAQCLEATIFNDGTLVTQSPYRLLNGGSGGTTNLWLTTGGLIKDSVQISGDTSMCIGMKGKEGSEYHRGIVVSDNTISTKEVLSTPANHSWDWYGVKSDLTTEVRSARIRGNLESDSAGMFNISLYDISVGGYRTLYNFNIGKFTAGSGITDLGSSSERWLTPYSVNSLDVSSDETLKSLRHENGDLSTAEKAAAIAIAKLPKVFQWISEAEQKDGTDETVYYHCSPMAQTVWAVLKDQGLNPAQYGFISDGGEDGTYSLQPNELMWMIAKAQQEKLEDLEFRLSALESK